jgi:hypothetical protein
MSQQRANITPAVEQLYGKHTAKHSFRDDDDTLKRTTAIQHAKLSSYAEEGGRSMKDQFGAAEIEFALPCQDCGKPDVGFGDGGGGA